MYTKRMSNTTETYNMSTMITTQEFMDHDSPPSQIDEMEEIKKMNYGSSLVKHLVGLGDLIYNDHTRQISIKGKDEVFVIYNGKRDNQICIPYAISKYCKNILKKYFDLIYLYRSMEFMFIIEMRIDDDYIIDNYGNLSPDYKYVYISDTLSGEPDSLLVYPKDFTIRKPGADFIDIITVGRCQRYLVS